MTGVDVDVPAHEKDLFGFAAAQSKEQLRQTVAPALGQQRRLFGGAIDFHKAQGREHHRGLRIGVEGFARQRRALRLAEVDAKAQIHFKVPGAFGRPHVDFGFDHTPEKGLGGFRQERIHADDGMGHRRIGRGGFPMRQSAKIKVENR